MLLTGIVLLPGAETAENEKANTKQQVEAWRGARILTATGEVYDPGTLVVAQGKIQSVGSEEEITIPEGAKVHDVRGKVIIPGLVDTHSHLGVYSRPGVAANRDGNEATGPVQGIVRALDALNPYDPGIKMALSGGVTTANVMPGSANVIGGQTIYIKLRGYTPEQMWIASEKTVGGLKMANGENPKRSYGSRGQAPSTRMKIAAMQRATFLKAQHYQQEWEHYRKQKAVGEEVDPPQRDLELEPLVEVLEKKRTVHFHTHRADDILTVLRLKREFDFELVIQHGTEAFKVAAEIAEANVPVSMTVIDSPGGKQEVVDLLEQTGAILQQAGVKVIINTDDPVTESRFLLRTAAVTIRGGLSEDEALRALTLSAAEVMHLDERIGSLETGKDADFVVLSGAPFSTYTRVLETWIEGKQYFSLADEDQRWYQTGGFALLDKELRPDYPTPPEAAPFPELAANNQEESSAEIPAITEETTEYIVQAELLFPVSGPPVPHGAVWVRDGKIMAVGTLEELNAPDNVPVVKSKVVTPGLIDAYSMVPLSGAYNISADQDHDEKSGTLQPELRVLDAFNPQEPLLRFLMQQGVTLIHASPGRSNLIAGQSGVFRTYGQNADEMVVQFPQSLVLNLGGEPKSAYQGKSPGTRMGVAAILRKTFQEAQNKLNKENKKPDEEQVDAAEVDRSKPALAERPAAIEKPESRDLKQEILTQVLKQDIPVLIAAQRADDLLTGLRLMQEFDLKGVFTLAGEAYLVRETLAESKTPVIVHPTMQRVGGMETYHSYTGNAAALVEKGNLIAIGTGFEDYVPKTRIVRHEAAMSIPYGLSHAQALQAITLDAARILKLDDQYGSLEPGKVADLVLYDGDPFEHATHVEQVIIDGKQVFQRTQGPIDWRELISLIPAIPESGCCLGF
ncbi:amidohydrolase family protein [Polystyrenella longa]|nr:amidohydrolase family protein [Polystyrenella longa]